MGILYLIFRLNRKILNNLSTMSFRLTDFSLAVANEHVLVLVFYFAIVE
jgi:hypothetical protein